MTARLLLPAALLGVLALAACDAGSPTDGAELNDDERVTGVWEADVPFSVDTVLAETNYRLRGDYAVHLRFDVYHDDGLAWGSLTATLDGFLIAREAGTLADTFRFDPTRPMIDEAFGTFVRPTLELDVPFGPYVEDLWTFEKVAGRLDLQGLIEHTWAFTQVNVASPTTFEFVLPMADAAVVVRRRGDETPVVAEPTVPTEIPGGGGARALVDVPGRTRRASLLRMGPAAPDTTAGRR